MTAHEPRTLLQLAGAEARPAALDQAVLVLIDHQAGYVTGSLPLAGIERAVEAARELLEAARAAAAPVIHVVQHSPSGAAIFAAGGPDVAIIPALAPRAGETVVVKTKPNSFAGTGLADAIASTGRRSLIVAGFMTHMCVSTTVRAALDLGYRCTVVANATATRDLPDPLGGVIRAAAVHRTALAELADRFAAVVSDAGALARV